jgi:hypothetical protein
LGTGLQQAIAREQARDGRVTRRRLNRVEYQNTMHDLLGIHRDLTRLLPEDQAAFGFDKISTALTLSRTHLERYLDATDIAIDDALGLGAKPKYSPPFRLPADKVIHMHNHQVRLPNRDVALFPPLNNPFGMTQVEGRYAFRCRIRAQQADGVPVYLRTFVGNFNSEAAGLPKRRHRHLHRQRPLQDERD